MKLFNNLPGFGEDQSRLQTTKISANRSEMTILFRITTKIRKELNITSSKKANTRRAGLPGKEGYQDLKNMQERRAVRRAALNKGYGPEINSQPSKVDSENIRLIQPAILPQWSKGYSDKEIPLLGER